MRVGPTEALIERLADEARPVRVLAPPSRRAAATLAALTVLGCLAILLFGDARQLLARYAGREEMMVLETAAASATGALAIAGAFFLSVPGGSRRWLIAPLAPLIAWLALAGIGCWSDWAKRGASGWSLGHSGDCLMFIIAVSLLIGGPLLWRLARARPIEPLPVAALGGLGCAALAAAILQFFHPFAVTFLDLAVHVAAVAAVVAVAALLRRRALRPA